MDNTLKAVVGLLEATDVEGRCAALVVLTRIKANDDKVVRAIGQLIGAKNAIVADFAVGYFESVNPKATVEYALPMLDSDEEGLRKRATAMLAAAGASAVLAARKLLKDAPRRRIHAILDLSAQVRSNAALDILFELMAGDDFDLNRLACDALIAGVPQLEAKARADLFARAEDLAAKAKEQRSASIAAAKLFGALGDPKARKRLAALLGKGQSHAVLTHALGALRQCMRGEQLSAAEVDSLLAQLDSDDENGVLRPAIALLDEQRLDRDYMPLLNRLADSTQPSVKRFAVQKLGVFDSGAVVKTLIGYLTDDSFARRDQATASLKKLPAARQPLMKELLACDDERRAWAIAEVLLAHERDWKRDALNAVWEKMQSAVEKREDRLHTAYFHFLNAIDAKALAERIRERAELLRKKKQFALVTKWLGLLREGAFFDDEARFALAIADLKSRRHSLTHVVRRHDAALDLLRELGRSAFPVAERLRKERVLEPEELFYAAFNFAEGTIEERSLAEDMLEHIVAKSGRTKIGKAAKNKLELLTRHR